MENIISKGIMAIMPTYESGKGNCTTIYTEKENIHIDATVRTVIKNLCAYYHVDMDASNKYFGELLSIKKGVPLPLSRDDVFIQLKVRKPIIKYDGTRGYFNLDSIEKVEKLNDNSVVLLKNGVEIKCIYSKNTVIKHIKKGKVARMIYENKYSSFNANDIMERYAALETPVTKADLAKMFFITLEVINRIK